jgi:diguanylate cyclase (GGDEF)-like protein/PAS domain S-box-containing protein
MRDGVAAEVARSDDHSSRRGAADKVPGLASLVGTLTARRRLMLLTLFATVPLLGLLLASAINDRGHTLAAANREAMALVRLAAQQEGEVIGELQVLLKVLARDPNISLLDSAVCNPTMRAVARENPHFQTLLVARDDGEVVCSSIAAAQGQNLADRPWFQRAIAPNAGPFTLSGVVVGRFTGKLTIIGAVPLPNLGRDGRSGILVAALDLSWLSDLGVRIAGHPGAVVMIIDAGSGTMLARYPEPAKWMGRRFADHPLMASFHSSPGGGTTVGSGLDQQDLIIGFVPLGTGAAAGTTMLAVGLPSTAVLAAARQRMVVAMGLAIAAAFIALGAAWWVAEFSQLRPLSHLTEIALRFGAGDVTARAAIPAWHAPEFRVLSDTLNQVAENLKRRGRQLTAARAKAERCEAEARLLTENSSDVIIHLNSDFRRRYVSPACREVLGYEPDELLGGHPRETVHPDDWPGAEAELNRLRAGGIHRGYTYRFQHKNGSYLWLEASGRGLDSDGFVLVLRDISLRKQAVERLAEENRTLELLASHDGLTHLANRRHFDDALAREFSRNMRNGDALALVLIDVDYFKPYNDLYGHPAGDAALRAIAQAVTSCLRRPADLAARYGGEEIAVLLPETDQAGAEILAERLRQSVRSLGIEHRGSPMGVVTVSMGAAATSPQIGGTTSEDLVCTADHALYAAKAAGRDRVRSLPVRLGVQSLTRY